MKTIIKTLAATGPIAIGLAAAAALTAAAPAAAQVEGRIATVDTTRAIIGTEALRNAYETVTTTYKAQIDQRAARQQQLTDLLKPFDTNGNGRLDEAEIPGLQNASNFQQIQQIEAEVAGLTDQVNDARIFAIEQIFAQYGAAIEEVANTQQIQIIMPVGSVLYGRAEADITGQVTTALNAKVPSVGVVPPQNYRPSQQGAGLFQEIQQRLVTAQIMQQRQQQQQQGNTEAPAGR
ncbi:MAG: OmpH family outer membrane protein [Erythrobacter sp.]|jgi:Skp family chaperone for outer membrane proteins|nr:OmpH family outer membrane protein [Erythrobacter sp.]